MAKGLVIEMTRDENRNVHYDFTYRNTMYTLIDSGRTHGGYRYTLWSTRKGFRHPSPPRCFDTLAEVEAVAKGFAGLEALITSLNEDGGKIIH